jgi:EAL domain-containing protein (putative c-di-GMP-specific phosphodiesterase class I)
VRVVPLTPRRATAAAGVLALVVYWAALAAGSDSPLFTHWAYLALQVAATTLVATHAARRPADRFGWTVLATGLALWTFGSVWQVIGDLRGIVPPFPSVADAFWVMNYPMALLAFAAFARPWLRRVPARLSLDALLVLLGTAALVTAVVLPVVMTNAGHLTPLAQVVNFGYPIADSVLLSFAVIGTAVGGWRSRAPWALLGLGIVALLAGDTLWTVQASAGSWQPVMGSNAFYPLWPACAAAAAWRSDGRQDHRAARSGVRSLTAAMVSAAGSILLLAVNEWVAVPAVSVVLAALALLVAVHRTGLALAAGVRDSRAATRDRELVDDVRAALERGRVELHYQPLVDTATGRVQGAEALLRWPRDGGYVPPDSFLPAVERSSLMAPLTDFVVDTALAAAARWRAEGHDLCVSVNDATANLTDLGLPGRVAAALGRHAVPASALTLEITETAAVEDNELAHHVLGALEELGVGLSVDDFGTGHSSLARLAHFPICELKIDRTFVQEMHTAQRPIVATAIQLAHALGLRAVAEGVEDAEALAALRDLGCDLAQGYFISRPLPGPSFESWLRARQPALAAPYSVA